MYKSIVLFRGSGFSKPRIWVDCCATFEWPWAVQIEALKDLKKLNPKLELKDLIPEDVIREVAHAWTGIDMRARFNSDTQGPFVIDHEQEKVSDKELIQWLKNRRR